MKREHYVPRFYLRRFADTRGQIAVFDKRDVRSFSSPACHVAAERAFFDLPELTELGAPDQLIEKFYFKRYEEAGAEAIRALLDSVASGRFKRLEEALRHDLAIFMAVQCLRTREFREQVSEVSLRVTASIFAEFVRINFPEHAGCPAEFLQTDKQKQVLHARQLLDQPLIEDLAVVLNGHIWLVCSTNADAPFWTSDNPVARHAHLATPERGMRGLRSRGIEIAFPLSPAILLVLRERRFFCPTAALDGTLAPLRPEKVAFYNSLQVADSTRFLFAPKAEFALAENLCRESPFLRDMEGRRVSVSSGSEPDRRARSDD